MTGIITFITIIDFNRAIKLKLCWQVCMRGIDEVSLLDKDVSADIGYLGYLC